MKEGLTIDADYDKGIIHIHSKELKLHYSISLTEFAKLSAKHLDTGKKMSDLLKEYFKPKT
jgi:hypothetical protein